MPETMDLRLGGSGRWQARCPWCGVWGELTAEQLEGGEPVVCGTYACRFDGGLMVRSSVVPNLLVSEGGAS